MKRTSHRTTTLSIYDLIADSYTAQCIEENKAEIRRIWKFYTRAPLISNSSFLDIGAGTGQASRYLRRFNMKGDAIEPSSKMAEKIKPLRYKSIILTPIQNFRTVKKYDFAVAAFDVFNHLSAADRRVAFTKIASSLKKNGKFLFDIIVEGKSSTANSAKTNAIQSPIQFAWQPIPNKFIEVTSLTEGGTLKQILHPINKSRLISELLASGFQLSGTHAFSIAHKETRFKKLCVIAKLLK